MDEEITFFAASADEYTSTVDDREEDLFSLACSAVLKNRKSMPVSGPLAGPIELIVVADAVSDPPGQTIPRERYGKRKPVFVRAQIRKNHLGTGEPTSLFPDLRNVIRNRGYNTDDCGHIISLTYGGHMVDYNLFPQNKSLNRGYFGNYILWRALEYAVKLWLKLIPHALSPRVQFTMLLIYGNSKYPDRPFSYKYLVRFFVRRKKFGENSEEDSESTEMLEVSKELVNVAKQVIRKMHSNNNLRKTVLDIIRRFKLKGTVKNEILTMTDELEEELNEIIEKPTRERSTTIVNFIPILGSLKTMKEGVEDMSDGSYLEGATNLAMGVGSLALEATGFGFATSIAKGTGKAVATAATRQVVKKAPAVITAVVKRVMFK